MCQAWVPLVRETVSLYQAKTQGKWRVGKNFDAPLPDALVRDFEGGR